MKNSTDSGTISVQKAGLKKIPALNRRFGLGESNNASNSIPPLHINYNQQQQLTTNNKLDTNNDKFNLLSHNKFDALFKNKTAFARDNVLSKIVVNELKKGNEVIGDKNGPVVSNITFTPENDTLTAMAYIAGNLLNKLWYMEKDETEDSIETELMKHEKISDLLELFKEPLTLRQEMFLKNALEKLSDAVSDKQLGNKEKMTICQTIVSDKSNDNNVLVKVDKDCDQRKNLPAKVKNTKVKNLADLVLKLNSIENNINKIKEFNVTNTLSEKSVNNLNNTKNENDSDDLNMFGNILNKLTNLLLPNKSGRLKKYSKKLHDHNLFTDDDKIYKKMRDLFNIERDDMVLTEKDRMLMDYLTKIEKNPGCLLGKILDPKLLKFKINRETENNILLNLSEFFKIKSMVDLVKLINPQKHSTNTVKNSRKEYNDEAKNMVHKPTKTKNDIDIKNKKEQLKEHLKAIVIDLIEIKNQQGSAFNDKEVKIADILPCLYNSLNLYDNQNDNSKNSQENLTPVEKVIKTFNDLKTNIDFTNGNRRTNVEFDITPKSVIVWDRMISDLNINNETTTIGRRSLNTVESFKKITNGLKDFCKLINKYTTLNIEPSERLPLLKSIGIKIRQYTIALEILKKTLNGNMNVINNDLREYEEFINKASTDIQRSEQIIETLKSKKANTKTNDNNDFKADLSSLLPFLETENNRENILSKPPIPNMKHNKFVKKELISQLVKNRLQVFLKMKEENGESGSNDISYILAQRILFNLDIGNYDLAKELFKILFNGKTKNVSFNKLEELSGT